MNVVPPLKVTDAVLTGSTLPEAVPATYSGVTTYAFGAFAASSLGLGKFAVYASQQPNNYGRALTDTFWWKFVGYVYEAYSGAATYGLLHVVTDTVNHLLYTSIVTGNVGNLLTDTTKWRLSGSTNKFAMFDHLRDTGTVAQDSLTVVLTPGKRINSLALLKMVGVQRVVITMVTGTDTVYTKTIDLPSRSVSSWLSWLFGEVKNNKNVVLFDLPLYTNGVTTITLTGNGEFSCGACVIGKYIYCGDIEYGAVSDASNYSTVTRNFDGSVNVMTQRRNAPKNINTLWIPKRILDDVFDMRAENGGTPLLWVGIDQVDDKYFRPLVVLGFFTNFPISLDYPNDVKASVTIEEI